MRIIWIAALAALGIVVLGTAAQARTLQEIGEDGVFRVGFRMDAKPLSFLDPDGNAVGYSVDLCRQVAEALLGRLGRQNLSIEYVPVDATERFAALETGKADILCGATTHTLARQERVDFSLLTFVTGAEMLVRLGAGITDLPDVAGKKVGVLAGTTTETGLRRALGERAIEAEVITVERHEYGIAELETNGIDAYFGDRILLLGLAERAIDPAKLTLSGKLYSIEPYALALPRGTSELKLIADRTLARLYRSGRIKKIYRKWFGGAKPGNLLSTLYLLQAIPDE